MDTVRDLVRFGQVIKSVLHFDAFTPYPLCRH